ncbi:MAG: NAD-dependent epimerase [Alphaproteobacteria bacterium]|nr:NAD-dependent epimerase [Alphaproteobacteria bacterium]
MTILVTGSAGFIGFHVTKNLLEKEYQVVGLDCLTPYYDVNLKLDRLKILKKFDNFIEAKIDLADNDKVLAIFKEYKPEIVINLAAQAGVRYSITNPQVYASSNLQGFLNILEGCRNEDVKHLVYASTSSVYGANTQMPFKTSQTTGHPVSLYAATKRANELMAHSYSHLFNIPCTGVRFFTVYGPWGRPDMALFLFTKAILENKPIDVYNFGKMARDFTYIDDITNGIVALMDTIPTADSNWDSNNPAPDRSGIAPFRIYNIGNNNKVELSKYIELLEKEIGIKAQKNMLPIQQGDVLETWADVDELIADTGYKPNTPVETGIARFVEWYREYYKV